MFKQAHTCWSKGPIHLIKMCTKDHRELTTELCFLNKLPAFLHQQKAETAEMLEYD